MWAKIYFYIISSSTSIFIIFSSWFISIFQQSSLWTMHGTCKGSFSFPLSPRAHSQGAVWLLGFSLHYCRVFVFQSKCPKVTVVVILHYILTVTAVINNLLQSCSCFESSATALSVSYFSTGKLIRLLLWDSSCSPTNFSTRFRLQLVTVLFDLLSFLGAGGSLQSGPAAGWELVLVLLHC